ncbi:hypothetical protein FCULG_00004371 [Fusarium culmorum]|uniref:Uncharacterized protein n=1 Tax=Fusarium culmorum TaxID=5516 RepID=A0A2T4H9M4_FUSCU|nr:hypothetical protein FCULG_00004371 [Fusarium culmorum]
MFAYDALCPYESSTFVPLGVYFMHPEILISRKRFVVIRSAEEYLNWAADLGVGTVNATLFNCFYF